MTRAPEPLAFAAYPDPHAPQCQFIVELDDGQILTVPYGWYPTLKAAGRERETMEICGAGTGVHFPCVDEDLSVRGLLADALRKALDVGIEQLDRGDIQ